LRAREPEITAARLVSAGMALCQLAVVGYAIPFTFGPSTTAAIAAATARLGLPAGAVLMALGMRRLDRIEAAG
jgi:hypothetical protein